jgi:hypothetical protein
MPGSVPGRRPTLIAFSPIFGSSEVRRPQSAFSNWLKKRRSSLLTTSSRPHPVWATKHRTLRFWVISKTNFLIYYLPDEYGVSIERVLDGRRDVARTIELGIEDPPELEQYSRRSKSFHEHQANGRADLDSSPHRFEPAGGRIDPKNKYVVRVLVFGQ